MADQIPGVVGCQCRRIHHFRNPCNNPARYCNWCKDGGCTIARQIEASAIREEARNEARNRGGGGYNGPPGMAMVFPNGPFGPPEMRMLGYSDDDDDDELD